MFCDQYLLNFLYFFYFVHSFNHFPPIFFCIMLQLGAFQHNAQWGAPQQPGYQQQVRIGAGSSRLFFCIAFSIIFFITVCLSLLLLFTFVLKSFDFCITIHQWGSGGWPPPPQPPQQQQGVFYGAMHQQQVVVDYSRCRYFCAVHACLLI